MLTNIINVQYVIS